MSFNLFGKRKKYPHNKKKAAPPAAVYAGPEYFRRRSGQAPEEEVLDVYAGPEYFERPPEEIGKVFEEKDAPLPPEEDAGAFTVYAGPEPPQETAPVYAGPEPPRERTALVYAGPEYFKRRRAEREDISALASGVYAGPEPGQTGMMGLGAFAGSPEADGKADEEA